MTEPRTHQQIAPITVCLIDGTRQTCESTIGTPDGCDLDPFRGSNFFVDLIEIEESFCTIRLLEHMTEQVANEISHFWFRLSHTRIIFLLELAGFSMEPSSVSSGTDTSAAIPKETSSPSSYPAPWTH